MTAKQRKHESQPTLQYTDGVNEIASRKKCSVSKNVLQSWSEKDVRTFVYAQQVATNYVNKCTNLVCIKYWTEWRQKPILNTLKSQPPQKMARNGTKTNVWRASLHEYRWATKSQHIVHHLARAHFITQRQMHDADTPKDNWKLFY